MVQFGEPPPMSGGWIPWVHGAPVVAVTRIRAFFPPNASDTPQDLFVTRCAKTDDFPTKEQMKLDSSELLLFTDGACLDNGRAGAAAGCALVFNGISNDRLNGTCSFRLEDEGPDGKVLPQTSNRAELKAAIAALEFRLWAGEGWARVVIATDSEYVALGATN